MRTAFAVAGLLTTACGRLAFDASAPDASDAPAPSALTVQSLELASTPPTSSMTFVDVPGATLSLPPSVGTRWLLLTSAQLDSNQFSGPTVEARYLVDGVEHGLGGSENSVAGAGGPWLHADVIDGTDAAQQVTYQIRDAAGGMAAMKGLGVSAIPLPANDVIVVNNDAPQLVTSTTYAVQTTLSLGPLTGEYLVILLVNANEDPGSDCLVQWQGPGGVTWLDETHVPRPVWQSELVLHREVFTGAPVDIQLYTRNNVSPSMVSYARAIAIPTRVFATFDYTELSNVDIVSTSMSDQGPSKLDLAPAAPASGYVELGSIRLREDCATTTADAQRRVHVVVDGSTTTTTHATDNCSYTATYGTVRTFTSRPTNLSLGYSSGNGQPVRYLGSQLVLLGVP